MDDITYKIITFTSVIETHPDIIVIICITIWTEQYNSTNYNTFIN